MENVEDMLTEMLTRVFSSATQEQLVTGAEKLRAVVENARRMAGQAERRSVIVWLGKSGYSAASAALNSEAT